MRKILLINQDQKFIGDLQTKFARRYEILATENYETAYQLCQTIEIDLLLARLPPEKFNNHKNQLKKFLKKIKRKKFASISRVLTVSNESDYQIKEYLKYGIAAIIVDINEIDNLLG